MKNENPYEYVENAIVGKKIRSIKHKKGGIFSSKNKIEIVTDENFNLQITCGTAIRMVSKIKGDNIENQELVNYLINEEIKEFGGMKFDMNSGEYYDNDSPDSAQIFLKVGKYKVDIWSSKVADIFSGGSGESNPLTIIYD